MTSLIIAALVGVIIPALVAFVTKEGLPTWIKQIILALLSAVVGVLSSIAGSPPTGWTQWQQILVAILVTFVAAVQSQFGVAEVHAALGRVSKRIGIGPPQKPPSS